MKLDKIIEGNTLIANFLEWDKHGESQMFQVPNLFPIYHKDHEAQTGWITDYPENMQFNDRWDWLMPVLEKISQHKYEDFEDNTGRAFLRTFGMLSDEGEYMVRLNRFGIQYGETLIEATYKAVVEFIEWYNNQNSK